MSAITTHVLDLGAGRPAAGVAVTLERLDGAGVVARIGAGASDADGRLRDLVPAGVGLAAGTYRLRFDTAAYFRAQGQAAFFPEVAISFTVTDPSRHHHVPLLLSAHGYTTYRGS